MRSKAKLGLLVLAGGVALAVIIASVLRQPLKQEVSIGVVSSRMDKEVAVAAPSLSSMRPNRETAVGHPAASTSTFNFTPGQDALAFIRGLLDLARSGNAEAQFAIYDAMFYCDDTYKFYFEGSKGRKTLDEAVSIDMRRGGVHVEQIKASHASCERLKSSDATSLGSAREWLKQASDGGLPKAQGKYASASLIDAKLASMSVTPSVNTGESAESRKEQASELMLRALNSKDPSVIWEVGSNLNFLTGRLSGNDGHTWVWRLAACKQGFDCSPTSRWFTIVCSMDRDCIAGESGVDYIRRKAATARPNIDSEADALLARLNRGEIEEGEFDTLIGKRTE